MPDVPSDVIKRPALDLKKPLGRKAAPVPLVTAPLAAAPDVLRLKQSPFPPSPTSPGQGNVVVAIMPSGISGFQTASYQYPLKLISPRPLSYHRSAILWLLSFGGGLVAGDLIHLKIDVRPQAKICIVTQGYTKVFKSPTPDVVTKQNMTIKVDDGAAICLLPDPVQPFKDSVYEQNQIFRVAETGSVCLLDWVMQGRATRGENWSCISWKGRNEIWQTGKDGARDRLMIRDTVKLAAEDLLLPDTPLRETMHQNGLFGTLILRGDMMSSLSEFFMTEFEALPRLGSKGFKAPGVGGPDPTGLQAWRAQRLLKERKHNVLWCAARIRGCTVVKFGSATAEGGRVWLGSMLEREGTIIEQFGEEAMFCVRN